MSCDNFFEVSYKDSLPEDVVEWLISIPSKTIQETQYQNQQLKPQKYHFHQEIPADFLLQDDATDKKQRNMPKQKKKLTVSGRDFGEITNAKDIPEVLEEWLVSYESTAQQTENYGPQHKASHSLLGILADLLQVDAVEEKRKGIPILKNGSFLQPRVTSDIAPEQHFQAEHYQHCLTYCGVPDDSTDEVRMMQIHQVVNKPL